MKIELQTDGGLAFLPGLARPVSIERDTLAAPAAAELSRLVSDADFFKLPTRVGAPPPGSADMRTYTLTITDGDRHHAVSFADPVGDAKLAALRDFVRAHAGAG